MRKENGDFARQLRQQQTDAEQSVWRQLRARQFMGFKFRRQYPLPPYVLDFYCAELALVIELDGGQHANHKNYDTTRTQFLMGKGLSVLRFWNNEVLLNKEGVLESVRLWIEAHPSPQPSPRKRGEGAAQ